MYLQQCTTVKQTSLLYRSIRLWENSYFAKRRSEMIVDWINKYVLFKQSSCYCFIRCVIWLEKWFLQCESTPSEHNYWFWSNHGSWCWWNWQSPLSSARTYKILKLLPNTVACVQILHFAKFESMLHSHFRLKSLVLTKWYFTLFTGTNKLIRRPNRKAFWLYWWKWFTDEKIV